MATEANEFVCGVCRETVVKTWTDAEAAAEFTQNFGRSPRADDVRVCDDCFQAIRGNASPQKVESVRAMTRRLVESWGA